MGDEYLIRNASVPADGGFVKKNIRIGGGRILRIEDAGSISTEGVAESDIDASGGIVLPGFIDIHTHGTRGIDFNSASTDEVRTVSAFFASQGVASYLPCVMTDTFEAMKRQLARIAAAAECDGGARILGIHLEGPYLSARYKGAMPEDLLRPCDYAEFEKLQEAAHGKIRLVTLAPEVTGAEDFIARLCAAGVRVSLGHSGADYEQSMRAIRAGAVSATHVLNAMKLLHMHDPAISTAILESDVYAEMICDGFHLHPPIVRLLLKVKGLDRMIAVTDSIMAAGCSDGRYRLWTNDIRVENGDAKLVSDGTRAGSTLTMLGAVRNIRDFTGLGLDRISRLVAENPARMLGFFDALGSIEEGKYADLVLLDSDTTIRTTIIGGKIAYAKPEDQGA